jgi:hypothetical protein
MVARFSILQKFSTAFHPQTDGQTERVNQVVEDYLRHYVNLYQSDWEDQLPMAEFAYNNSFHTATQSTPFRLNYGYDPLTPLTLLTEEGKERRTEVLSKARAGKWLDRCPAAQKFTEQMQDALASAKRYLEAAQQKDKHYADKHRRPVLFEVGEQVLLASKNIKLVKGGSHKLLPRYIGPFTITKVVNANAYQLDLPSTMRHHKVINVSWLKKYIAEPGAMIPPMPVIIDNEPEWFIDHIVSHRDLGKGANKRREYFVRWEGMTPLHDTWETEENIRDCVKVLKRYNKELERQSK